MNGSYTEGYNAGKSGRAVIVALGQGQEFNVASICSQYGVDPASLSTNNFLVTLAKEFNGGAPAKRETDGTVYNVNITSILATYSAPVFTAKFVNAATSYGDHCATSSNVVYADVIAFFIVPI